MIEARWGRVPERLQSVEERALQLRRSLAVVCDAGMRRAGKPPTKKQVYWWSEDVAALRFACNRARREYTRCRRRRHTPEEERLLHGALKEAKEALCLAITKTKDNAHEVFLATLDRDPWGRPYKVVRNKMRYGPTMDSLELELLTRVVEGLFPPALDFAPPAMTEPRVEASEPVAITPISDDKGESIWDHIIHARPEFIYDRSTADVACDSYHLWEEDLKLVEDLGLDFYRFSVSWPRLLPTGFVNKISEDGRRYYSALIAGLRARGVKPVVTLYHWDLPQRLQDLGGWTNPLTDDWFADYARVVFTLFAGQVKTWITINEPGSICDVAYRGLLAPGIKDQEIGVLLCSKYVLLAHAKAYRIYEEEFKPKYGGDVSIANQESWFEPKTDEDLEITLLAREYMFGRYSYPIYSTNGGWPPTLEIFIAEKSEKEGYRRSRLPAFTKEEIQLLKGSYDFYALNHYTSRMIRVAQPGEKLDGFMTTGLEEIDAVLESRLHWETAQSSWLKVNPEGLRHLLSWIKQQYGDVKIMITENGYSDSGDDLNDATRVKYYQDYLNQVHLAITEDRVNVVGYTAWSLIDNFEWVAGYLSRFGLYHVDFSDPRRPRSAKASARYYRSVVRARSLDVANNTANFTIGH